MATPAVRAANLVGALVDGTPTNAVVTKYAQSFWDVYGPDLNGGGLPIVSPTNAQLATFMLKRVRQHFKDVMGSRRAPAVAETARKAELAAVAAETDTELGIT